MLAQIALISVQSGYHLGVTYHLEHVCSLSELRKHWSMLLTCACLLPPALQVR